MRSGAALTIRAFSVAHIALGAFGLAALLLKVVRFRATFSPSPEWSYELQAFCAMTAVNQFFVICLVLAGLSLWRDESRGLRLSNFVLTAEIIYTVGTLILEFALGLAGGRAGRIALSMGAVEGVGNMGIVIQQLSGYPVIALIALNIAHRRLKLGKSVAGSHL